jgi:GTPase SAR1 family protein
MDLFLFRRESFSNLSRWLADARALASPQLVVVLVGSKSDLEEDREVEWAEASKWAAENGRLCLQPQKNQVVYIAQMCIFSKPHL